MVRVGGKQILAEFKCHNIKLLNDGMGLEAVLAKAAAKNGFSVKTKLHHFTPYGITAIAILGESHIIIHTYPEYKHLSLDCYTCFGNPNKIVHELVHKLKLIPLYIKEVLRGREILKIEQQNWMNTFLSLGVTVKYHIKKNLFTRKSKYQQIDIIENDRFGKMLFLDNDLQITEHDVKIYNSNLVPKITKLGNKLNKVLILGGGDGGVANELLKQGAKEIVLVDIDSNVVNACKKFMPKIWGHALNNPKIKIIIADAYKYLEKTDDTFDVIIYDLTSHPEKVGVKMNQKAFLDKTFSNIKRNLKVGGMMTMQCCEESDKETLRVIHSTIKKYFSNHHFVKSFIPSYCVNWIFAHAQNK